MHNDETCEYATDGRMRQEIEQNLASKHHLLDFMIDSSLTYRKDRDNRYLFAFCFTIGNATPAS